MYVTPVYNIAFSASEITALSAIGLHAYACDQITVSGNLLEDLRVRIIGTLKDQGIHDFSAEALDRDATATQQVLARIARQLEGAR